MMSKLTGCLAWTLVTLATGAQAQVQTDLRWDVVQVADPASAGASVRVYFSDSAAPVVVPLGSTGWFDGATATRIEWHFDPSEPIADVEAVAGGRAWPFLVDQAQRRATLVVTHEVCEAWAADERLRISCDGGQVVELRLRPRELRIGPDGAKFSVDHRASAFIPGSREWAEVFLDNISGGWVRLEVRTVEGETLAPTRTLSQGPHEAVFWIGSEEYAIQVERVKGRLRGGGSAELRVKKRWSAREQGPFEIEAKGAPGPEPPLWFKAIERIERGLMDTVAHLSLARTLLDEGRTVEWHAAVEQARQSQEEVRQGLRSLRCRPRLRLGPEGVRFLGWQRDCVLVPGSRGWVEVVLNDITGGCVSVGVRTAAGETLALPRPVAAGDEVTFWIGGEAYAIEVERLWNFLIGRDYADLRLERRSSQAEPPAPGAEIGTKVIELIEQEFARAEEHTSRAEMLLTDGKTDEARAAIHASLRSQEELQQGVQWIQRLTGEELMKLHLSVIEDLSLVKVRVVHARPEFDLDPDLSEIPDPADREAARSIERLNELAARELFGVDPFAQYIEAQIVETHTRGSRYAFGTDMGRQFHFEKRHDVDAGRTIELHLWEDKNTFPGIRGLEEGQEYWLALTPPLALKFFPRRSGQSGRTWITFVMPSRG
ncbi:MAG: hypothetical protein AB1486_20855 [Planctomycetota bacterium]